MPTPEQIEKKLKETADLIETAVKDINENKATKKEVVDLIEERTKGDRELITQSQTSIKEINSAQTELKEAMNELRKNIKQIHQFRTSSLVDNGRYKGYFSSPQEAKAFALLVMAATMSGHEKLKDRYDNVRKSLDDLGLEPNWVDASGRKAMTGSSQAGGGALVTVEQIPSIQFLLEEYGKFRANAQPMPMGAGQTIMPKIDGLLEVTCPGEGGTATEKEPDIKTVSLTPKTLIALTAYSIELEDDSLVALGELLAGLFARSFAYYEDLCGFLGDGTGTYFNFKGIAGALLAVDATIGNIKSLVVADGNAYSEITLANFGEVPGTLPDFADDGDARWYAHRYFFWTVMVKLALAAGGTTAQEIIIGAGQRKKQFLSYPVEFTQVMPKAEANSQICALLANLRQGAYMGTRGGIEFAQSSERYFEKGLIAVRGRDRIAINAHGVGDTTSAGPICGMIMAGS